MSKVEVPEWALDRASELTVRERQQSGPHMPMNRAFARHIATTRAALAAKDAEVARLKERLELTGDFADGPDGIECRDETIRLQDERIAKMQAVIIQLGENAAKAAGEYAAEVARLREDAAEKDATIRNLLNAVNAYKDALAQWEGDHDPRRT